MGEYTWQSSGYCGGQCSASDYFAITNGNECFCGSELPTDSTDSSQCSINCPGFPSETCGGTNAYQVFAQANVQVSSSASSSDDASSSVTSSSETETRSSTTANTSSTSASTSSEPSSTSEITSSNSALPQTTSTPSTSTSSAEQTTPSTTFPTSTISTSSSSSSESTKSPTTTPTSSPEVQVHTLVSTTVMENSSATVTSVIYVTATASTSPSSGANGKSSSVNKGAIVGGAVGGVLGFLLLIFAVVFLLRRRIFSHYYEDADIRSIVADDVAYEEALKVSHENPFSSEEDEEAEKVLLGRRRLSDGSLADATDYGKKVLRVANPDDED